jgi:hypothetical protein
MVSPLKSTRPSLSYLLSAVKQDGSGPLRAWGWIERNTDRQNLTAAIVRKEWRS